MIYFPTAMARYSLFMLKVPLNTSHTEVWLQTSGQIVGERGGTAFPFRFWRGNAVPLAYTTAVQWVDTENGLQSLDDSYLQHRQQKNVSFNVTPIDNMGNFKSCIL